MDVNVPPGESTLDHSHDRDVVTVAMSNGAETRAQAAGQSWANRPRRPVGDIETTEYAGKVVDVIKFETMGTTAYQLFAVENLKANGWSTTPAASGAGHDARERVAIVPCLHRRAGKGPAADLSHARGSDDRRASEWQGDVGGAGREGEGERSGSGRPQADRSPRVSGCSSLRATRITSCDWAKTTARSSRLKFARRRDRLRPVCASIASPYGSARTRPPSSRTCCRRVPRAGQSLTRRNRQSPALRCTV